MNHRSECCCCIPSLVLTLLVLIAGPFVMSWIRVPVPLIWATELCIVVAMFVLVRFFFMRLVHRPICAAIRSKTAIVP